MMWNRIILLPLSVALLSTVVVSSIGCKSRGGQPSNPFALDRQTAPPPATFSHQQLYMGQQPGASYTPQVPATTYPSTETTVPAGAVPVYPSGASTSGNGSIGSDGAVLFQTSMTTAAPVASGAGATSEPSPATEIASVYTSETAWKSLETQRGTTTELTAEGEVRTTVAQPESFVVSSSQMVTQIMEDTAPEAVTAEPKTLYAGQYQ